MILWGIVFTIPGMAVIVFFDPNAGADAAASVLRA